MRTMFLTFLTLFSVLCAVKSSTRVVYVKLFTVDNDVTSDNTHESRLFDLLVNPNSDSL